MPIDSVKHQANTVVEALRADGHGEVALALEALVRDLDCPARGEAALNQLIGHCHIRALGDLNIRSMRWQDWLRQVETLARVCRRELKHQGTEDWQARRRREEGRARARSQGETRGEGQSPGNAGLPG